MEVVKYESIKISSEIYEKIKEKIEIAGFDDVTEFVNFILAEFLKKTSANKSKEAYEEEIKERLKALGYLE